MIQQHSLRDFVTVAMVIFSIVIFSIVKITSHLNKNNKERTDACTSDIFVIQSYNELIFDAHTVPVNGF